MTENNNASPLVFLVTKEEVDVITPLFKALKQLNETVPQCDAFIKNSVVFFTVQACHSGIIRHGRAFVKVGPYVCLPKGAIIID